MAGTAPPPPPPPSGQEPEDLAAIQRQRVLSAGKKITAGDLAQVTGSGLRVLLFLGLLGVALVVTVFVPPLGIALLFLLGLVALTAR